MAKRKKKFDSTGSMPRPVVAGSSPQSTTVRYPGSGPYGNQIQQGLVKYRQQFPFQPFKPYQPPPLPSGSYDPALDAQVGAAGRGIGDLERDTARDDLRDRVDYGEGRDQINQGRDRGLADLDRQFGRGTEDLDWQSSMLQRSYSQLANRQSQQINAAGLSGGAALQAAAKRAANMAVDQRPIDTARQRLTEDTSLSRSRLEQDTAWQLGQLAKDFAPPGEGGPLGGRRFQDRADALARAQRENVQFGIDVEALKAFQAGQSGYEAPGRGEPGGMPRNEFSGDELGIGPHRRIRRGGFVHYVRPDGSVIKRKRVK